MRKQVFGLGGWKKEEERTAICNVAGCVFKVRVELWYLSAAQQVSFRRGRGLGEVRTMDSNQQNHEPQQQHGPVFCSFQYPGLYLFILFYCLVYICMFYFFSWPVPGSLVHPCPWHRTLGLTGFIGLYKFGWLQRIRLTIAFMSTAYFWLLFQCLLGFILCVSH